VVPKQADRVELADLLLKRGVKPIRATRVALRVLQWAIVAQSVGHFPSVTEYASWTGDSERTAWRHRAAIREVFSEDEFRELVEQISRQDAARLPRKQAIRVRVAL
jgi:hypothetical protein